MTLDNFDLIAGIGLQLIAFGYFTHGWFWNDTHSLVIAAVFLLIAQ